MCTRVVPGTRRRYTAPGSAYHWHVYQRLVRGTWRHRRVVYHWHTVPPGTWCMLWHTGVPACTSGACTGPVYHRIGTRLPHRVVAHATHGRRPRGHSACPGRRSAHRTEHQERGHGHRRRPCTRGVHARTPTRNVVTLRHVNASRACGCEHGRGHGCVRLTSGVPAPSNAGVRARNGLSDTGV